jgi:hypothetical protein
MLTTEAIFATVGCERAPSLLETIFSPFLFITTVAIILPLVNRFKAELQNSMLQTL